MLGIKLGIFSELDAAAGGGTPIELVWTHTGTGEQSPWTYTNFPSGHQEGDVIIVFIGYQEWFSTGIITGNPPSGWDYAEPHMSMYNDDGTVSGVAVEGFKDGPSGKPVSTSFYKVQGASVDTTFAFGYRWKCALVAAAFRNVDVSNPPDSIFDDGSYSQGQGMSLDPSSVTTSAACAIVTFACVTGDYSQIDISGPSGYDDFATKKMTMSNDNNSVGFAWTLQSNAGTEDPPAFTQSTGYYKWSTTAVGLKPA